MRNTAPGPAVRVMIVDDSAVARAALARIITEAEGLVLVATARGSSEALTRAAETSPDVILLDLTMPGRDGLAVLPELLSNLHRPNVLIVSTTAAAGAAVTLRALALGAADTLEKPDAGGLGQAFGAMLVAKVIRLGQARSSERPLGLFPLRTAPTMAASAIGIGASTGGIGALATFLGALPANVDAPIFVTQHLPPAFTASFATQLHAMAQRPVRIATDGMRVRRGEIVVAPGNAHMLVRGWRDALSVELSAAVSATRNCPSVDPMFATIASAVGASAVGVVLSGMGRDGASGVEALVAVNATIIVQDSATSTIWGMPGVVARAGHASLIAGPAQLAAFLAARAFS